MDLMRRRIIMGSILAAAGVGLNVRGEVISVCPHCGREHVPGMLVCPHCQGALAPAPATPSPAEPSPPEPSLPDPEPPAAPAGGVSIPSATVRQELREAMRSAANQESWAAMRQARNSRMYALLSPDNPDEVLKAASDLVQGQRVKLAQGTVPCPVCQGEKTQTTLMASLEGELRQVKIPNTKCAACKGTGSLPVRRGFREQSVARARELRAYDERQRGRGCVRVGATWLPSTLDAAKVPAAKLAAARRAFAVECDTCGGLGGEQCVPCAGLGIRPCPQQGCLGGRMACPDCNGTRFRMESREDSGRAMRTRCSTCASRGHVECPVCRGNAFAPCEDCGSKGIQVCKTCTGTGVPPDCRTCKGEGVIACRSCAGVGNKKGVPCPDCASTGSRLCDRCQGFGSEQKTRTGTQTPGQ